MPALKKALQKAHLQVRVISEGDDGAWNTSNVDGLVEIVRRGYELLVAEDIVVRAVEDLEAAIEKATETMIAGRGEAERLADLLGIPEQSNTTQEEDEEEEE
jgi:hypothetical protein